MLVKRGECFNHPLLKTGMKVRCLTSYHQNYVEGREYTLEPGASNKFSIEGMYTGRGADWLVLDLTEPKSLEDLL